LEVAHLNFESDDYIDLIDWQSSKITEPPVLKLISDEDLEGLVRSGKTPVIDFPRFPCHTQAVEGCFKSVTEAFKSVAGYNAKDGLIRARNNARKIMPRFNTKNEYRTQ